MVEARTEIFLKRELGFGPEASAADEAKIAVRLPLD
jgi:hypothetical protein